MVDKKVDVKVVADVNDSKVEALEKKLDALKKERLRTKIEADTQELESVQQKIEKVKSELKNLEGKADVDASEVDALKDELASLENKALDLEVKVKTGELEAAKQLEKDLNGSAEFSVDVDTSSLSDIKNMEGFQTLSEGISTARQGISGLVDGINEVQQAGMQSEQNLAFLTMNMGAEKARATLQDINNIVASMPGDDNTMRSILSTAQALNKGALSADEMRVATGAMADYLSGSAANGKLMAEAENDLKDYLLTGNTACLERDSIYKSQIDKLKDKNTFQERANALDEAAAELGYKGLSQQDTMINKQAEWEGMIYNSQDALSSMWLGAEQGAMDYILQLNDASDGLLGMGLVATEMAAGPLIDVFTGIGQIGMGASALKDGIQWFKELESAQKAYQVITEALIPVQYAEGTAGWFSIGWIAVAILLGVALGLAFIYLYQHSEQFRNAVNWLGNSLKWLAQQILTRFSDAIRQFGELVQGIPRAIQACLDWAYNVIMSHPVVQAAIWLGQAIANGFSALGLGQHSPGKIVKAITQEMTWSEEELRNSTLPRASARLGERVSDSFTSDLNSVNKNFVNGSTGGQVNNFYFQDVVVDNDDRMKKIMDYISRELRWNNVTAGRTV